MLTSNTHSEIVPLRDSERSLLQDASAALLVCDDQGKVSYFNSQAEDLLGMDARRILGHRAGSLFRLEGPRGDLLVEDRVDDLYRRQVKDEVFEGRVLVRADGQRLRLTCEIAAIGGGSVLILLRSVPPAAPPGSLAYRASHDALTGLPNRSYMQERLENLHRSSEAQGLAYSLLLLDLDRFKTVNDRFGHATGDRVLVHVGRRIAHMLRDLDTVGRWGGEEFLCLLPEVGRSLAEEIAERIRAGLESQPVEFQGRQLRVTSSIGMATFPDDGPRPDALMAKADAALYEAKRSGRNRIRNVASQAGNVFALGHIIEKSVREERMRPAYQTVVNLVTGQVCGAQAVARIQLDDHQVMDAAYFIPAAERLHLVHRIDHRIIRSAVMRCTSLKRSGEPMSAIFVNFSADFLRHPNLVEDVRETIEQQSALSGDAPDDHTPLVIEITGRQFMDDMVEARERLQPFLDMGVRIAIDNFAGGYSALSYLIELPISFIKLEGALVRRVCGERRVRAVLQGIQELASGLGIVTVAEGIENEETLDALREIGVDWGQGYYFSRPVIEF